MSEKQCPPNCTSCPQSQNCLSHYGGLGCRYKELIVDKMRKNDKKTLKNSKGA